MASELSSSEEYVSADEGSHDSKFSLDEK